MEKKQSIIIPMLTLRGMTVFPNMIVSLPQDGKNPLRRSMRQRITRTRFFC